MRNIFRGDRFALSQGTYEDQRLSQKVQKAIEREKSVAVSSKNIQVVVHNGVVILRGEVFVEQEKIMIGNRAACYAGSGGVDNQLAVAEEME